MKSSGLVVRDTINKLAMIPGFSRADEDLLSSIGASRKGGGLCRVENRESLRPD